MDLVYEAFLDALVKEAASSATFLGSQSRRGKPAMLMSTLLAKSEKGTLQKKLSDMTKQAGLAGVLGKRLQGAKGVAGSVGEHLAKHDNAYDIAGLGVLAAPSVDKLQAHARARIAGDKSPDAVKKREHIGPVGDALAEVGGLGVLAAPVAAHMMGFGKKHAAAASDDSLVDRFGKLISRHPVAFATAMGAMAAGTGDSAGDLLGLGPKPRFALAAGFGALNAALAHNTASGLRHGYAAEKHAASVSDEEAERAVSRIHTLDQNKPTVAQVGRYAGLGAAGGIGVGALKDTIAGDTHFGTGSLKNRIRRGVGSAVAGAVTSGALPLVRTHLDRGVEKEKLKNWMSQNAVSP